MQGITLNLWGNFGTEQGMYCVSVSLPEKTKKILYQVNYMNEAKNECRMVS